jgi:Uma2 family endonuclease
LIGEIHGRLWSFIGGTSLGVLTGAETGFLIAKSPDTVLAPDVAFVRAARVEVVGYPKAFFPEAPALVVEVVSPSDKAEEVDDKMRRWLLAGVELGWLVYPRSRTVSVYHSLNDIRVLGKGEVLDGGTVLPGFRCFVDDLFAQLSQ